MDKIDIRHTILRRRNQLQSQEVAEYNTRITARTRTSVNWSQVHLVHVYTSQVGMNEVDTGGICTFLAEEFPAITITKGTPSKHALIPTGSYDVILVPLVAFDTSGHRIGFGGGWYDRFLSMQPHAQKIGLAYELQRVDYIPAEPHDEYLNVVVTEKRIYVPNKNTPL